MNRHEDQLAHAIFESSGAMQQTELLDRTDCDAGLIASLAEHLKWLSDDLDLPLEGKLPEEDGLTYRITSDGRNAYIFYYDESQIVHLALLLGSVDESDNQQVAAEAKAQAQEMTDSIRLLLLDETDDDDLDAEAAAELLGAKQFDFASVPHRPVVLSVLLDETDDQDASTALRFARADVLLGRAFFERNNRVA